MGSGSVVLDLAERYSHETVAHRRRLHENPEISNAEHETADLVSARLSELGVKWSRPIPTGVVGVIAGDRRGPTVGLRADMDALPVHEKTGTVYASQNEGVMHACGHDGHTAALLTAARILLERKEDVSGTVRLFFQPAEERGPSGAQAFLDVGAVDGVAAMMGLHLWNGFDLGKVSVEPGVRMATGARVKIRVRGKGGHGAMPHLGVDALVAASAIVMNLQTIASRELDINDPAVITIGTMHAGTAPNVLAQEAELEATVKFYDPDLNQKIEEAIRRVAANTARTFRAEAQVEYISRGREARPLVNDPALSRIAEGSVRTLYGEEALCSFEKLPTSEDFARYSAKAPLLYAFVGAKKEGEEVYPHHHPKFDFDEKALTIAAALYAQFAIDYLAAESQGSLELRRTTR